MNIYVVQIIISHSVNGKTSHNVRVFSILFNWWRTLFISTGIYLNFRFYFVDFFHTEFLYQTKDNTWIFPTILQNLYYFVKFLSKYLNVLEMVLKSNLFFLQISMNYVSYFRSYVLKTPFSIRKWRHLDEQNNVIHSKT